MRNQATSPDGLQWRKSSRTNTGNDQQCVELAVLPVDGMAIRDSKHPGPRLTFSGSSWAVFAQAVKRGAHDNV